MQIFINGVKMNYETLEEILNGNLNKEEEKKKVKVLYL